MATPMHFSVQIFEFDFGAFELLYYINFKMGKAINFARFVANLEKQVLTKKSRESRGQINNNISKQVMSIVSKIAGLVTGDYEITCFTDPAIESSYHNNTGMPVPTDKIGPPSEPKTRSYTRKPAYRNKLAQYIQGETDILCFSPSPEDCSDGRLWEGLAPNNSDDEDDLIFIDNGDKTQIKRYDRNTQGSKKTEKVISDDISTQTPRVSNHKLSTRHNYSTGYALTAMPNKSHRRNPVLADYYSGNNQLLTPNQSHSPFESHFNQDPRMNTQNNSYEIHGPRNKSDRPSPNNVTSISTYTHKTSSTQANGSSNDFLKALYDQENNTVFNSLLDVDESESKVVRKTMKLDFELAGFTPEEALTLKRRIKLQNLVRTLNADLSM